MNSIITPELVSLDRLTAGSKREVIEALAALVGSPDPVKNIDPSNPRSHLSHILIPRPRTLLASTFTLLSPLGADTYPCSQPTPRTTPSSART